MMSEVGTTDHGVGCFDAVNCNGHQQTKGGKADGNGSRS